MCLGCLIHALGHSSHDQTHEDALEILKVRYAKGEISEKEFQKMKQEITE